ncbi:MAG: tRNA (adenosine(37)-N6)-threonylcarbamoyltransferase complex ATPase subunit type 1 TsaE [Gemmatimonadetes bacterium]|nr:tRNA (adenosine(37)-N6)-threonylcarbamoyltransferase complex ATPase subunit type 1 TsaE [Gemmatimonadota bacterium]
MPVVRPVDRQVSREVLQAWGEALGATLVPGDLIALRGDLGAGKTTLAQAIARGFGITAEVTSPTYALVHQYVGDRGTLWHLDLYRIASPNDLLQLGWDDILAGDAAVMIEWPERAGPALPAARLDVHLETVPGDAAVRRLVVA